MDITERKITKIAREAEKLVLLTMREEGVGTAEIDLIHALRHHPGCTQAALAELLHADKAAIARRTKNSPYRSGNFRAFALTRPIDRGFGPGTDGFRKDTSVHRIPFAVE